MKKMVSFLLLLMIICLFCPDVDSQCAMCKQVAEDASAQSGDAIGLGLNNGIKYLLVIPYILFGIFMVVFFRRRQ